MRTVLQARRTILAAAICIATALLAAGGCTQSTSSTIAQTAPVIKAEGPATTISLGMR